MADRILPDRIPRRILQRLPVRWQTDLGDANAVPVTRGMSGARLWRLRTRPTRYLKFAEGTGAALLRQEAERTAWLRTRGVRVARIVRFHDGGDTVAMLTDRVAGIAADQIDWPVARVLTALGRGLAALHAMPLRDCPFDESLPVRLARAQRAVERDEVDATQFEERNRHVTPRGLLRRLRARVRPRQDFVLAHGDASLSNLLLAADGSVGFVDCGHAGRGDRYLDLGVAAAEIAQRFGAGHLRTFTSAYGLSRWNTQKAAFYGDLYEFF